jgi:hypothetical protein
MSEEHYCEPCRRFLVGELLILHSNYEDPYRIFFDHHLDYGSFEKAMQLPCLICTSAWANEKKSLNEIRWKKLVGCYHCDRHDGKGTLYFWADQNYRLILSYFIFFEPFSGL